MLITAFQYLAGLYGFIFLKLFTRLEILGRENLKGLERPFILTSNHESHMDPQLVGIPLLGYPKLFPLRYMTKYQLFYYPILNLILLLGGSFAVNRKLGIEKALETPLAILRKKGAVIMFPEGKVIAERPKLGDGKRGAAILALMTGSTILPMAVNTPHDLLPILPITFGRPRVTINVGKPYKLDPTEYPDLSEETIHRATQTIMERIGELYYQHQY